MCQIMIYDLTFSPYVIDYIVLQGNMSLTFSLMSYSSEGHTFGHIKSMFSLIICDMFVLISFSSQPQINFVAVSNQRTWATSFVNCNEIHV